MIKKESNLKEMKIFGFEKLEVWKKSRELSVVIYRITASFPKEEKFGLTSQMRRAVISIASNLAEGSSRHSNNDKARFTEIAFGSAMELLNQCLLATDLKFLSKNKYYEIREKITEITAMLNGLHKSQKQ